MRNINFLFLSLCVVVLPFVSTIDESDDANTWYYIVVDGTKGQVLDASYFEVRARNLTLENPYQLWRFDPIANDGFYVTNRGNNKVLDIKDDAIPGKPIITWSNHGGSNQIWHIDADGVITGGLYNGVHLVVEINGNGEAVAEPKDNERLQKFSFVLANKAKEQFDEESASEEEPASEDELEDEEELVYAVGSEGEKEPVYVVGPSYGEEPTDEDDSELEYYFIYK